MAAVAPALRPPPRPAPVGRGTRFADGNPGAVLQAALDALAAGRRPVLALVVETEGSTYAATGTLALFDGERRSGWISGGCLEPEIARLAGLAADAGRLDWLEIDTTDDGALFLGSAVGCRGRQLLALLPLAALPGVDAVAAAWLAGGHALAIGLDREGGVAWRTAGRGGSWRLPLGTAPGPGPARWSIAVDRAPEALVLGAGPETPVLVPMLRALGWRVAVAERRARWRESAAPGLPLLDATPAEAVAAHPGADVALVMHHGFEPDRDALEALAASRIPFVGLLGPARRRRDLFKLLRPGDRDALADRLRSPVGIPRCGRGAEAIALSIATQLQVWRGGQA
ncbi:XdhC family protein [Luteimonas sp. Y-2-2-4F]|nr:XdhC/CoxI family protein [Luteimonas sp. Y-2-2-4F]MCD9032588.1 XdhC family protein [Luteimonas sp. Y-2-2-4F]